MIGEYVSQSVMSETLSSIRTEVEQDMEEEAERLEQRDRSPKLNPN